MLFLCLLSPLLFLTAADKILSEACQKQRDDLKYMLIFNAIHKMEAFYYPWIEKES
jgi:hypothetical protein